MKSLTKKQLAELARHRDAVEGANSDLKHAVVQYNEALARAADAMIKATEDYNAVISEVQSFREDVHTEITDYIDERSDAWRESERGEAFQAWADAWEEELELTHFEEPDALDEPEVLDIDGGELFPEEPWF